MCRFAVSASHQTIRNYLKEGGSRAHQHAVLVASINTPKIPATTTLQHFDEAVSLAHWRVYFDRITAVFLTQPDGSKHPLPPIRSLHVSASHKPFCGLKRSKAQRASIGRLERDLISGLHREAHFGYSTEGKEFWESPVSRNAKLALPEYQTRNSVVNSKAIRQKGLAGMGRDGNHPYIKTDCCRLQRTTNAICGAHCPIQITG